MNVLNEMLKVIHQETDKIGSKTGGRVYLAIEKRSIPGLMKGEKFDVSFRIKYRRYNAFLFSFYLVHEDSVVLVEWGDGEFRETSLDSLRQRIQNIINDPAVINSSGELLQLYQQSYKTGIVKTIAFDTLGGNDFEIAVNQEEFAKYESAFNAGDTPFEIIVTELEDSILPSHFVAQISAQYRYLEMDGLRAYIDKIEKQGKHIHLIISDVHL